MILNNCTKLFESFRGGTLFVGFSGGADSTAALLLAARFGLESSSRVVAVHFDHGLRGEESHSEAEEAQRFAEERGIEFRLFRLNLLPSPNLEDAARAARLAVWRQLAADQPGTAVVLGHHSDDRAENFLLRLLRGSNASGLAGLRSRSQVEGVTFLRPLLSLRRREIEEYLHKQNIQRWAEDSSNADESLTRNALRRRILPEIYQLTPGSEDGVFRSLDALEADAEFLEAEAERRFRETTEHASFAFWRNQPPAMRIRLLRKFVAEHSGYDYIPNRAALERFDALLASPSPELRRMQLDAERTLLLRDESLELQGSEAIPPEPISWDWTREPELRWNSFLFHAEITQTPCPADGGRALFDADQLPAILRVDYRRDGDRMVPFGESTERNLKKLRVDRGIPADSPLPVLRNQEGAILWAPEIRHSNIAVITAQTRRIVSFTIHKLPEM